MIEKRKITLHRLSKLDNDDHTSNTRFDRSVEDKILKSILKEMESRHFFQVFVFVQWDSFLSTRDSIKSMIQFDNGIKIDAFLNAFKVRKKEKRIATTRNA